VSAKVYSAYKDTGVDWLGAVPAHWEVSKLKYLASFSGGGTPSRDNPRFWNGSIPWISPKDMKAETIEDAEEHITEEGLASSASNLVPSDAALLVVRSGILKHTIPVARNAVPVALNQDMKALRFRPVCLPMFFLRWVQGLNDQLLIQWSKQGATVESIEHAYLVETPFPLPPITEQSSIAVFLDRETGKIDALVEAQRRLIELLKEKRKAVISHAVTKGLDPAAPMKGSGVKWLGDAPAHWEVKKVKHVTSSIEQGWSPQCENYPVESPEEWGVLKVGCVNGGRFNSGENKTLPSELEPLPDLAIRAGDILVSRANTRDLVGSAAVVDRSYRNLLLCDKLYRLRLNRTVCVPEFLSFFLGAPAARGRIELAATGASDSMLNIGQSTILDLALPLPPVDEQGVIVSFLHDELYRIDELIGAARSGSACLSERRAALISAAVTGKIDVRDLAPAETEAA
jgi:type I restriction enzyme S subunit